MAAEVKENSAVKIAECIGTLNKSLNDSKEQIAQLKAQQDATKAEYTKSLADLRAGYDEKLKGLEAFEKFAREPDYGEANPYKVFAQAKDTAAEGRMGYKSLSSFCRDLYAFSAPDMQPSEHFKSYQNEVRKAPTGMNETAGSEGGFLVPPAFSAEIWKRSYDNSLFEMTTSHTASANSNSLEFPAIDETSRVDGSRAGGVRMYWDAEANQYTTTKPSLRKVRLQLHKLMGIVYGTDELRQDTGTVLEQFLHNVFSEELNFKLGDSLVNGTGSGMPLGILNAAATISVSKETGQAAATLLKENLDKMYSRMHAPCRAKAVWLINQDIEPQLFGLTQNVGTGGTVVYLPPGGLSAKPYGTLYGRPVMPVEFCATLGTVGDIIFADLSQWYSLKKGEAAWDTSIHLRFDYGEQAWRMTFRADSRCMWASSYSPYKGSNTKSCAVSLATRA